MIARALETIEMSDIQALQSNAVEERRTLDFKLELYGGKDEDKRELIADVTSFANTDGGDIIFGVAEKAGIITEIPGVVVADFDKLKLRFNDILRDCTEPRLQINFRKVDAAGKTVVVFRIDRSWARPHRAKLGGWEKFFGRSSAGKYPLNVGDLRNIFMEVAEVGKRVSSFHVERLIETSSGRAPFPLEKGPTFIFHLIPLSSVSRPAPLNVKTMHEALQSYKLNGYQVRRRDYTFEGVLTHSDAFRNGEHEAYSHFYRSGAVEAVGTNSLTNRDDKEPGKYMTHWHFENEVIQEVRECLRLMAAFGVNPPVVFAFSVFGVKGLSIYRGANHHYRGGQPIREDVLTFPGSLIENFSDSISSLLRPLFDQLWNACGLEGSENYDKNGERLKTQPQ